MIGATGAKTFTEAVRMTAEVVSFVERESCSLGERNVQKQLRTRSKTVQDTTNVERGR